MSGCLDSIFPAMEVVGVLCMQRYRKQDSAIFVAHLCRYPVCLEQQGAWNGLFLINFFPLKQASCGVKEKVNSYQACSDWCRRAWQKVTGGSSRVAQNLGEAMRNSIVSILFRHVYSLRMSLDVVGLRTCLEASGLPEVQHRQSRAMESNFDIQ